MEGLIGPTWGLPGSGPSDIEVGVPQACHCWTHCWMLRFPSYAVPAFGISAGTNATALALSVASLGVPFRAEAPLAPFVCRLLVAPRSGQLIRRLWSSHSARLTRPGRWVQGQYPLTRDGSMTRWREKKGGGRLAARYWTCVAWWTWNWKKFLSSHERKSGVCYRYAHAVIST
jgi:hypothetical protein